jgi:hypothetical protein
MARGRRAGCSNVIAEQPHALPAEAVSKLAVDPDTGLSPRGTAGAGGDRRTSSGAATDRITRRSPCVSLRTCSSCSSWRAAVSFLIGEQIEAAVIAAIVVLNAVLGFVQRRAPSGPSWRFGRPSS